MQRSILKFSICSLHFAMFVILNSSTAYSAEKHKPIDLFSFPTDAAARAAWRASDGTPPIEAVAPKGIRILAPFSRGLSRTIHDCDVTLDLSYYGEFALEVIVDNPDAFSTLTLYFRSGDGWHGGSGTVAREGRQTVTFNRAAFRPEGNPAGWGQITGIRLSAWAVAPLDAALTVIQLVALLHDVVIILPTAASGASAGDIETARRNATYWAKMLEELGTPADALEDREISTAQLEHRRFVVLPLNPQLPARALDALQSFVKSGGKLFVAYLLPEGVDVLLEARRTGWIRQERPNQFASIRLNAPALPKLPKRVRQSSWNITIVEPQSERTQPIGYWYDGSDEPTAYPALLLGSNGAFLSHILLPDDWHAKKEMFAHLLGFLVPEFQPRIADRAMRRLGQIGHLTDVAAVSAFVRAAGRAESDKLLREAEQLNSRAKQQYAQNGFLEAAQAANDAREKLAEAYLLSQPSPEIEGRAVWNHAGTGAYPGDWERSARELAQAGFNMVLPNMLWAGLAHYPSAYLPQSETFTTYGDQIAQCVAAARKHGLEVHVWKVNWNLQGAPEDFVKQMRIAGRTQVSRNGTPIAWLCPSHPENVKLELDSLLEVVEKYDVDGLHFDYIRYPGPEACYCSGCRQRFTLATRKQVKDWPNDVLTPGALRDAYLEWRTAQITRLVRLVHERARALKPKIKLSAAIFGNYPTCIEQIGQDWVGWAKAGYVDFLCPMNYTEDNHQFTRLVKRQIQLLPKGFPLYPGIGATASSAALTSDGLVGQIFQAREANASGFTIFDYSPNSTESILPALLIGAGANKAKPPHR